VRWKVSHRLEGTHVPKVVCVCVRACACDIADIAGLSVALLQILVQACCKR
jgi:hypothetical protein